MSKVLIVEDEKPISDLMRMGLTQAGYTCECADNGMDAASLVDAKKYDMILLDVMLPGADGYELLEYIRPLGIPVIFITAKADVADRVRGLRMGADDYLTKPFEVSELLARVESVLRRYRKNLSRIRVRDLVIDTGSRLVNRDGAAIPLTNKEYELLLYFVRNRNIALYRETIYEAIWESPYMGDSRTVDLHVQRLRKKLGWEGVITAVYKVGYRLEIENEAVVEDIL